MEKKQMQSFRLSPTAKTLLASLAKEKGISQSAVLEQLIREKAKKENIRVNPPAEQE